MRTLIISFFVRQQMMFWKIKRVGEQRRNHSAANHAGNEDRVLPPVEGQGSQAAHQDVVLANGVGEI